LFEIDYERVPCSPIQFLEDDYYIGKSVKHLSPFWKEQFCEIFASNSKVSVLILTGSIGSGKCITGDSLVLSETGFTPISKYSSGNNGFTAKEIKVNTGLVEDLGLSDYVYEENTEDTVKISTYLGNTLEGTPEHPVLILKTSGFLGFKKLEDLEEGVDWCYIPVGLKQFSQVEPSIAFSPIVKRGFDSNLRRLKHYPEKMSPVLGTILGYLLGDGCLNSSKTSMSFSVGLDRGFIIKDFKKAVKNFTNQIGVYKRDCYDVRVSCKEFKHLIFTLLEKQIDDKVTAEHKEIPSIILQSTKQTQINFIRALMDCDGGYYQRTIEYCSKSEKLVRTLQQMLLNFGIVSSVFTRRNNKYGTTFFYLSFRGIYIDRYMKEIGSLRFKVPMFKRQPCGITYQIPYLKQNIIDIVEKVRKKLKVERNGWFSLEGKKYCFSVGGAVKGKKTSLATRILLENIVGGISKMPYIEELSELKDYLLSFLKNDFVLSKVKTKENKKEKVRVYDLSIPKTHSFVSNGFISHNTTFGSICQARKLYELSCLKSPSEFYGLLKNSKIVFGIYNVTLTKADDISELIKKYVDESPYFKQLFPRKTRPDDPIYFPSKNIEVVTGSLSTHALGDSILSFVIDEANFYKKSRTDNPNEMTRAHQLFNEANTRLVSRYMKRGKTPGLITIISSKKFQSSFVDKLIDQYKANPETAETVKVIDIPLWKAKNPADFCGKTFKVLVGTEYYGSRILEPDEVVPFGGRVVSVPIEYFQQFVQDTDLALRDIAGVSTKGSSNFFPVKERILQCMDKTRKHPFSITEVTLPFKVADSINIYNEFFLEKEMIKIVQSTKVPIVHPGVRRNVHIDIAYKEECLGITMAHPFQLNDGRLGVYIDFMLRVKAPVSGEIDLQAPIQFLKDLRSAGFSFGTVTFDQYQSRLPIQQLLQAGFQAELLSIGISHFTHLRKCFNEGRISMYEYYPLLEEIEHFLKDPDGGRPHHDEGFFDDVLDSLASVVSRCYNIESTTKKKVEKTIVNASSNIILGLNDSKEWLEEGF